MTEPATEPAPESLKPKNYRPTSGLLLCFFSASYYRHVLTAWTGFALRFLLMVSVVFAGLVVSGEHRKVMTFLQSAGIEQVAHSMPLLTIEKGKLSTAAGGVEAVADEAGHRVVVVDPKDSIANFDDAHALVLLQSEYFTVRKASLKLKYASLVKDGTISGAQIIGQLKELANASLLPLAVAVALFCFVMTAIKAMLLAFVLKSLKLPHSFVDASRLLIVAFTPSTLLTGLTLFLNLKLVEWDAYLFNCISIAYIIFAFRACRGLKTNKPTGVGTST